MELGADYAIEKEVKTHNKYSLYHDTIVSWIHPAVLLGVGMLCLIGYMITEHIYIRMLQVVVFFSLAVQIKHIKILYFIMLTASITFFYLLVPQGKVLYEFFFLKITEDALRDGMFRGLTLVGYVFLSLWCISPRLRLPSRHGKLLTKSIHYFTTLVEISSDSEFRKFVKEQKQTYKKETHNKEHDKKHEKNSTALMRMLIQVVERIDLLLLETIRKQKSKESTREAGEEDNHEEESGGNIKSPVLILQKFRGLVSVVLVLLCSWSNIILKILNIL